MWISAKIKQTVLVLDNLFPLIHHCAYCLNGNTKLLPIYHIQKSFMNFFDLWCRKTFQHLTSEMSPPTETWVWWVILYPFNLKIGFLTICPTIHTDIFYYYGNICSGANPADYIELISKIHVGITKDEEINLSLRLHDMTQLSRLLALCRKIIFHSGRQNISIQKVHARSEL